MRILRLELEGFGPFRDRQSVSFEEAAAGGILLISGRTGAGKSSLLDAVSFALYGAVPRYEGQPGRVRSDHLPPGLPTRVRLDFEMRGQRYRVERQPEWERPKRRGDGTTVQKQEAALWVWDDGVKDWVGVAARPIDVAAELGPILGLNQVQFLQVVLLAQGGFQRFLHAEDHERQATLRSLFQTARFEEVERTLIERRRALAQSSERIETRIHDQLTQLELELSTTEADETASGVAADSVTSVTDAGVPGLETGMEASEASIDTEAGSAKRRDAIASAIEALQERVAALETDVARADERVEQADRRLQQTRVLAGRQQRLDAAVRAKADLQARCAEIEENRSELAGSERTIAVDPFLTRERTARARQSDAERKFAAARDALTNARGQLRIVSEPANERLATDTGLAASTRQALQLERDEYTASLGRLGEAMSIERDLTALREEIEQHKASVTKLERQLEQLAQRGTELPKLITEAREHLVTLRELAALLPERAAALTRASTVRDSAEKLTKVEPRLERARQTSADRSREAAEASRALHDLLERRLGGMAGELATSLKPGSPCAVCGATEHPAPASHEDPVLPEQIDEAEARERATSTARDLARDAEREVEAEHTELRTRSEGASLSDAEAQNREAERLHREAAKAESEVQRAQEVLTELESEQTRLAREERETGDNLLQAKNRVSVAEEEEEARRDILAKHRGAYRSIDDRYETETGVRDGIDKVLEADRNLRVATDATSEAVDELATALKEHGFTDSDSVRAAARPTDARERLQRSIDDFDTEKIRIESILDDPELQHLPESPAPLEQHQQELGEARTRASGANVAWAAAAQLWKDCTRRLKTVDHEIKGFAGASEELLKLRRLADTVQGKDPNTRKMRLEVFLLAARLEAIVAAANRRLELMVGGRYTLEHDDSLRSRGRQSGLGLRIMDAYTGRHRSAASLSGGETFLASLALALGLADVVSAEAGGITLDTLFVDEGFGSLDPDALDQAMATLDGLREGGRSVVLISHVAEMKERIPAQLEVIVDGNGVSALRGAGVHESAPASSAGPAD